MIRNSHDYVYRVLKYKWTSLVLRTDKNWCLYRCYDLNNFRRSWCKWIALYIWISGSSVHCHYLNSSPPSSAYMSQRIGATLVQIMACRLFGAKPLSKRMLGYCQLNPLKLTSVKFESKYKLFIHENARESVVCEMTAILSRGRWADTTNQADVILFC